MIVVDLKNIIYYNISYNYITFTFRAFSRRFYLKLLRISTLLKKEKYNTYSTRNITSYNGNNDNRNSISNSLSPLLNPSVGDIMSSEEDINIVFPINMF